GLPVFPSSCSNRPIPGSRGHEELFLDLVVESAEGRLLGPQGCALEERVGRCTVALVNGHHRGGVAHGPEDERARLACPLEEREITRMALVGEGAGQGADSNAEHAHPIAQGLARWGKREALEAAGLLERAVAIAFKR